jgi:hypothetical protein
MMLSEIIELNKIDATNVFPHLYGIFCRDFVATPAMLGGTLHVDPQSKRKSDGCEDTFWHLTTRTDYKQSQTPSVKIVVASSNWSSNLPWGDGFDDDKIHKREERARAQPDERAA